MNIFKQFYKSIYSPKDIATFRFQGMGKTILYVFFLSLLAVIPTFYSHSTELMNGIAVISDTIDNDLPDFTIQNGTLTSDRNEPLEVQKGEFTILFDSSGTVEIGDISPDEEFLIAVLKHDVIIASEGTMDSLSYAVFEDAVFTKQHVQEMITMVDSASVIFLPILFVILYIVSAGIDFLEVTILALIGLIVVSSLKREVKYGQLWRLTAYSVTLPTVFFIIMGFLKTTVPAGPLIHWGITIIFLYLAIKEIPASKSNQL